MRWLAHAIRVIKTLQVKSLSYSTISFRGIIRFLSRGVFVAERELLSGDEGDLGGSSYKTIPRPNLPPVLILALFLWASGALVLCNSSGWSSHLCLGVAIVGLVIAVGSLRLMWSHKKTLLWISTLGIGLGMLSLGVYSLGLQEQKIDSLAQTGEMLFEVVDDGSSGLYGSYCIARVCNEYGEDILVQVLFSYSEDVLHYGQMFSAYTTLESPSESSVDYLWTQGVIVQASISQYSLIERNDFKGLLLNVRDAAIDLLSQYEGGSGVLAALVCGWRQDLSDEIYSDFKVTGLAHIVAVSGAHLSIVSAFLASIFTLLRVPHKASIILHISFMLCYLVLAAAPPSAVRAVIMASAALLSISFHRRNAAISALAICIFACIVFSPPLVLSVSFALSVLSTLGIIIFSRLVLSWIEFAVSFLPRFAKEALALTLASGVATAFLAAALFAQVSLIAPLANIVVAPFFAPLCTGGLIALVLALAFPFLADIVVGGACYFALKVTNAIAFLSEIPYASIPVEFSFLAGLGLAVLLMISLWIFWPTPSLRRLVGAISILFAFWLLLFISLIWTDDEIIMLDIDQGDAFIVRSQGSTILIDTGNQDTMLYEALARHGIYHLDAVVITHGDDDHMGSLSALCDIVVVDCILLAEDTFTCGCDSCEDLLEIAFAAVGEDCVLPLSVGDVIQVGLFTLTTLWPQEFSDEGGNDDSLCFLAEIDLDADEISDWTILFTGDAESEQIEELISGGYLGSIDILKVGHHGSAGSITETQAGILEPSIALISAGVDNSYGHPVDEVVDCLESVGALVFCTAESGDVSCKFTLDQIEIITLR